MTPDTILRWYRELIAKKYDGTSQREGGRPGTATSLQRLVVRLADDPEALPAPGSDRPEPPIPIEPQGRDRSTRLGASSFSAFRPDRRPAQDAHRRSAPRHAVADQGRGTELAFAPAGRAEAAGDAPGCVTDTACRPLALCCTSYSTA